MKENNLWVVKLTKLIAEGIQIGEEHIWGDGVGKKIIEQRPETVKQFVSVYWRWHWAAIVNLIGTCNSKVPEFKRAYYPDKNRVRFNAESYRIQDWERGVKFQNGDVEWKSEREYTGNQLRIQLAILEFAKNRVIKANRQNGFASTPKKQVEKPIPVETVRAQAWEKCESLASSANILEQFAQDLHQVGLVGEDSAAKSIFLVIVSRLLEHPASLLVKGPPSSGKTIFVEEISQKFFAKESCLNITLMSENTLSNSEENFRHRTIVLGEAVGMSSRTTVYLVRSLISSGKIVIGINSKATGSGKSVLEGPTNLVCTTTSVSIDPDTETRCLSITMSDSREQTKRVLEAMAEPNGVFDSERWIALQTWLSTLNSDVVIPFRKSLVLNIEPTALRVRRDAKTVLSLIQAHALIHAASRDKDEKGRIVATLQDYSQVYALVSELIDQAAESSVPNEIRETVQATIEMLETTKQVSLKMLADKMNVDRSTASRRVNRAISLGFLVSLESRKGQLGNYKPGAAMPENQRVLPTPEQLAELLKQEQLREVHSDPGGAPARNLA